MKVAKFQKKMRNSTISGIVHVLQNVMQKLKKNKMLYLYNNYIIPIFLKNS
jgi:hypothetical protein